MLIVLAKRCCSMRIEWFSLAKVWAWIRDVEAKEGEAKKHMVAKRRIRPDLRGPALSANYALQAKQSRLMKPQYKLCSREHFYIFHLESTLFLSTLVIIPQFHS
uniref:Secreted protein n=1 Tax=Heterorhabditis bacteriophora TaxID=37862 RepID=A0A1I7X2B5_HETBA